MVQLFIFLLCFPAVGLARWADMKEADYEILFRKVNVKVKADGTSIWEFEEKSKILTENGRNNHGYYQFYYSPKRNGYKVLAAKTIKDGKEYPVKPEFQQDKSVAQGYGFSGFDDVRQITVVFPQVSIGSELYIKFVQRVDRPMIPGWFQGFFPGGHEYVKNVSVKIDSEISLTIQSRDPDKVFELTRTNKKSGGEILKVKNKRPYYYWAVEEANARRDLNKTPILIVSSLKSWQPVIDYYTEYFEKRRKEEALPPKMAEILAKAKELKTERQQIDFVMAQVIDLAHYVGDWRTHEGAYFPRKLAEIESTRFADCKDFSYMVVRILQDLGMDAAWSLVLRDSSTDEHELYKIPFSWFNHAFVNVKGKEQEYWLEPTSNVIFSQSIPQDTENRFSLVLRRGSTGLTMTPEYSAENYLYRFKAKLSKTDSAGQLHYEGFVNLTERAAVPLTQQALNTNGKELERFAMSRYVKEDMDDVLSWEIKDLPKFDRSVKDISFKFKYTSKDTLVPGSFGPVFILPTPSFVRKIFIDPRDRVLDVVIGPQGTDEWIWELPKKEISGKLPSACEISNEFFTVKRDVSDSNGTVGIRDSYKVHKDILPLEMVKSPAFQQTVDRVKECFRDYAFTWN